MDSVHFL